MTVAHTSARTSDVRVIGLVSLAHGSSHFFHLILPPLFPWLKNEFAFNYAELGLLMSVFYVVSCAVQAASGFLVDRIGSRPVLFGGVGFSVVAALIYSQASGYEMLVLGAIVAGLGNGIFHPVDYTLINHKVTPNNLAYAYSLHGVTGYLGWAAAPIFMVTVATWTDWRLALLAAAAMEFLVLVFLWINKNSLLDDVKARHAEGLALARDLNPNGVPDGIFAFLKLPSVWLCWLFFFFSMIATSSLQSFSPSALLSIYSVPVRLGSYYLTLMSLGSAGGMLLGGLIAKRVQVPERVVTICLLVSILVTGLLATSWVPHDAIAMIFLAIGLGFGMSAPSRDLMIRAATPQGASGRVYGIVYSGIDLGAAVGPILFGVLLDTGYPKMLFIGAACAMLLMVFTVFQVASSTQGTTKTA